MNTSAIAYLSFVFTIVLVTITRFGQLTDKQLILFSGLAAMAGILFCMALLSLVFVAINRKYHEDPGHTR